MITRHNHHTLSSLATIALTAAVTSAAPAGAAPRASRMLAPFAALPWPGGYAFRGLPHAAAPEGVHGTRVGCR